MCACSEQKPAFSSIDVTGADYAKDFALTDHNGQPKSLKDFAGKVVVMFFGYTQCPDVCPTTMAELAEIKKLLGSDGSKLQGVFVSIDPERDTPAVLKAYMVNFDPSFLALVPTPHNWSHSPKITKSTTKRSKARPTPATPWTTRPAATSMTRKANCACSPATAPARNHWQMTSRCC